MKNKNYLYSFIFVIIIASLFLSIKYFKYRRLKSEESYETYFTVSIAMNVLSFYEEEWHEAGVEGLISGIEKYSSDNGINYFSNVIGYLQANRDQLNLISVLDSNTLIVYHYGFNGVDDSLKNGFYNYSELNFLDYLLKKDNDIIVTYLKDYKSDN